MSDFITDFFQGQKDCQKGLYKKDQSDSYQRGYRTEEISAAIQLSGTSEPKDNNHDTASI